MKLDYAKYTVTLPSDDGDAVFVFREMKENQRERILFELTEAKKGADVETGALVVLNRYQQIILDTLESVTGIVNEDGSAVTPEQVRTKDVPQSVFDAIMLGYQAAAAASREAVTAKKQQPAGDSQSA